MPLIPKNESCKPTILYANCIKITISYKTVNFYTKDNRHKNQMQSSSRDMAIDWLITIKLLATSLLNELKFKKITHQELKKNSNKTVYLHPWNYFVTIK